MYIVKNKKNIVIKNYKNIKYDKNYKNIKYYKNYKKKIILHYSR